MSTYIRRTKNPATGEFEDATWLDDHFGRHRYGVAFADGKVYRQSDYLWEFEEPNREGDTVGRRAGDAPDASDGGQEGAKPSAHPQLLFIRRALRELESLRDAAVCNGPGEQKLAAYLRAACKCMELAEAEAMANKGEWR